MDKGLDVHMSGTLLLEELKSCLHCLSIHMKSTESIGSEMAGHGTFWCLRRSFILSLSNPGKFFWPCSEGGLSEATHFWHFEGACDEVCHAAGKGQQEPTSRYSRSSRRASAESCWAGGLHMSEPRLSVVCRYASIGGKPRLGFHLDTALLSRVCAS